MKSRMKDVESQTVPMAVSHVSTDAIERPSQSTQTSHASSIPQDRMANPVLISGEVIEMIIEQIERFHKECEYFTALESMHGAETITPTLFKTISITPEKLPVAGVRVASNNRVLVLIGEPKHESWCAHNFGQALLYTRRLMHSIELRNCPTEAAFLLESFNLRDPDGRQPLLVLGTATGELLLASETEVIGGTDMMIHSHSVTTLLWDKELLVSTALDGKFAISRIRTSTSRNKLIIEQMRSVAVTVIDVPRTLRRANTSDANVGISSLACSEDGWFVAGEIGAVWFVQRSVELSDKLNVQLLPYYEPEGIDQLIMPLNSNKLAIRTCNGLVKCSPQRGSTPWRLLSDSLPLSACPLALYRNHILLVGGTDGELLGYDLDAGKVVLSSNVKGIVGIAVDDQSELLVAVDEDCAIGLYNLSS